jgi:peptidoglycan/xylan/chitin deacetylase (PgdA/CDA1 family)
MRASLRHLLFDTTFRALAATGLDHLLAPLARGRGAILMFHHVRPWRERAFAPNRLLEITPDFLDLVLTQARRAGFAFARMDEVPERLRGGGAPFLVLTFDDGYRDNVVHAAPVMQRHGAPWTLFVTPGFADGTARMWWLELEEAIARLDRVALGAGAQRLDIPARSPAEKQAAFETIYWRLRAGPEERLLEAIAALAETAGLDRRALVPDLCLRWDELARLAGRPEVTIGAHTLAHPMLAKHDDARAREEIAGSGRVIAERLGIPVRHFAYPVGDRSSAGARDFALAREAGYLTAVTTRPGHVFPEHARHLHALPRVSMNGYHQNEAALRGLLSGVPFALWNRFRHLDVT